MAHLSGHLYSIASMSRARVVPPAPVVVPDAVVPPEKPDWSVLPVEDLVGTEVEWSSISPGTRAAGGKVKACLFCGYQYTGGPNHIRQHLDGTIHPRNVSAFLCAF